MENIRRKPNYVKNVAVDKRYFQLLAELFVYGSLPASISTIEVRHTDGWLGLNFRELPIDPEIEGFSTIHAVDKGEKAVIIKIHLDRKKEDIIKDVKFLLGLLNREAKSYKVDLKAKKPQWDVYEKYLQVYDLKDANPQMEWSEIAKLVFPAEVIKEHNAPHRKTEKGTGV